MQRQQKDEITYCFLTQRIMFFFPLWRNNYLTHMPSSTSCFSSVWRPCSLSALCHFSSTICGLWERTEQLLVDIKSVELLKSNFWLHLDFFNIHFQKPLVFPSSRTVETKTGFLSALAETLQRCLEIKQSTGWYLSSQGESNWSSDLPELLQWFKEMLAILPVFIYLLYDLQQLFVFYHCALYASTIIFENAAKTVCRLAFSDLCKS